MARLPNHSTTSGDNRKPVLDDRRRMFRRHLHAGQTRGTCFPVDFVPVETGNLGGVLLRNDLDAGERLRARTWHGITLVAVDHTIARTTTRTRPHRAARPIPARR